MFALRSSVYCSYDTHHVSFKGTGALVVLDLLGKEVARASRYRHH